MPTDFEIKNTPYYSKKLGELADGCKYCVKGRKLVLYITGLCPRRCHYCPLGDEKYNKDVVFANEKQVLSEKNEEILDSVVEEAMISGSHGAGITGGDPLARIDRTVFMIEGLKKRFQTRKKKFHIHLYTSLDLVDNEKLRKLYLAGLDEIRFHPDLDDDSSWGKIDMAIKYNWHIGIEIPVIPGKEKNIKHLIEKTHDKIQFMNLNELEIADNTINDLAELGFQTKDSLSYAVKGSYESGKEIMEYVAENDISLNLHLCTAKLKDKVQLAKRIKLRAKNAKNDFDELTDEGLLVRGVIYPKGFEPGFGYNKKIRSMKNTNNIKKLKTSETRLKKDFRIKDSEMKRDENKLRLLTSIKIAKKLSKKIKNRCAIVTEYPTDDSLEIELEFLN